MLLALLAGSDVDWPPPPSDANRSFHRHVQRLGLDVDIVVPIHGQPMAWNEVERIIAAP